MPLHYIIDGYNLLNNRGFLAIAKPFKNPRQELLIFIKMKLGAKNKITVVFDGYTGSTQERPDEQGITVIFSCDISADDKIKNILEATAKNTLRQTIVVSNDREVLSFAKLSGAAILKIEELLAPKRAGRQAAGPEAESKPGLNYTDIARINEELKRIWLK